MFNKKFMFMAIFIVGLLAISAAGAADLNTADEVAIDGDDLQISMGDENIIQKNAEVENDLENDANEFFSAVSLENDDYYVSGDDSNLTEAKLEVVKTPTNPGDNTVIFKLTKVEDNSPLANVSLGVKSDYDHFIDGIITDSNGLATYYHALESGTYSLIAGLGDADGFGSSSETLHCDLLFFSITIKEQTDGSVNEIVVSGNTFTDIQNAVSSVKKGGTVKLSGKYEGTGIPIRINRNITLIGVGNTILDGNCSSLILRIVSSGVSIKGLTFINGYTDLDDFRNAANRISAGAIQATGNNTLIQNCIFLSNQGFMYGAIELNGNHSTIEDCSFTANEVYLNGRTYTEYVYESDGRRKDITYAYENTAGAFKWSGNDNLLSNCEFIDNVGYVDFIFEGKNNVIKESKLVLSASDVTKYMGGSEKYTVTLTDNGVPVANVNVKINVNGKESTVKTNSKGQASADLNMGVGSYDVISEYGDLRTASKVNVKSTITVADAKGTYLNSKDSATFLNTNGKALANTKVNFKIGTETYSATTNSNGVATANIDLGVGTYTVTAVNPVNNEQKTFKLTISKTDSKIALTSTQSNGVATLTATLTPTTASGNVVFNVNSENRNVQINNGKATLTLKDLEPGNYTVTASYNGDKNLNASTSNAVTFSIAEVYPILTAKDLTKTYGTSNKFVVNLVDSKGNAIPNAVVNVNINNMITPIPTDSDGQASMPINLAPATYTATVTYGNDAQTTTKITVKKATPKLTAKAKTFKKSVKTKNYVVTFKTNTNKVMKKAKLTLKVNGKTYSATTNSKGQVTFKITKLTKKGKFTGTIAYKGNAYYNKLSKKVKITIK